MAIVTQSWMAKDTYATYYIYSANDAVPDSAVVNVYVKENGSTSPKMIATHAYGDIEFIHKRYECGKNAYGVGGVEIVGYTDGIEWDNVQWSTAPLADDISLTRTSVGEASIGGTNRANYVGAAQGNIARYTISHNSAHYYGEYTSLPFDTELSFLGGYDLVEVEIKVQSQSSGSGIFFYSASKTFRVSEAISAPLAPTITSSPASVVQTGSQGFVSWVPNHPDFSAQYAAQVRIDSSTYNVPGAVTSFTILKSIMSTIGTHTLSVRTQNAIDQSWGPWSSTITFQVRELPSLSVSSPTRNYVLTDLPLIVSWDASDDTGISQQRVELMNSLGSTVWQAMAGAEVSQLSVGRDQYYLESGQSYSIRVTVTNGVGLSSSATVPFSVSYVGPSEPEVEVSQGAGCSASVTVTFVGAFEDPDTESVDVYRVLADGTQTLIGTVSSSGRSVTDQLPPLNVDFSYRAVAFSESGASTSVNVPARVDSGGMEAWNFGPSASTALLLGLNASGSRSTQFSGETFHFALGPGTPALPTFYPDGDLDATGSHSYVVHGVVDYLRVRGVIEDPSSAVCWFRDAFGGRHTVHASWQTGYDSASYNLFTVTASATEVVWEEPTI